MLGLTNFTTSLSISSLPTISKPRKQHHHHRFRLFASNNNNNGGGGGLKEEGKNPEKQPPNSNGGEEEQQQRRPIFGLNWSSLLDRDPDNIVAVGLTGLLTWASVQVLWQLLFISFAILVAALKYSFIAALLIFILIALL